MVIADGPLIFPQLLNLPALAQVEWQHFREGIEICRLHDNPGGSNAALLRYTPGASLRRHTHLGHEYIVVLQGSQIDDAGEHKAGTILVYPPGTSHSIRSPQGCMVLIVRDGPVSFAEPDSEVAPL